MKRLFHWDVLVDVPASCQCIVEDVGEHDDDEPVAGYVADVEGEYVVLDERHDATAHNEHHEDA